MVTESKHVKLDVKAYLRKYFEQLNQFGNKKGEEYFQIVSKATKQKF